MKLLRIIYAVFAGLLLLSPGAVTASAEVSLPDGLVQGLPEGLAVLDSDGRSPDDDGGYLVDIGDMVFGETYTKKLQIMNLCEDASYHIYFGTQPLDKSGEIDLEDSCVCTIELNGKILYEGSVTGRGNVDMSAAPLDLGVYTPGSTDTLTYSVTWNKMEADAFVDNGHTLYDENGKTVLRPPSGDGTVGGEVQFKWLFYAETEVQGDNPGTPGNPSNPNNPNTTDTSLITSFNPFTGNARFIFPFCIIVTPVFIMAILFRKRNKAQKPQEDNDK